MHFWRSNPLAITLNSNGFSVSALLIDAILSKLPLAKLVRYRRVPRQNRSVSRKGIILRDGSACQYCGSVLAGKELTMDHVVPRSCGGFSTWENLASCCFPCNNRKGNRTPQESGMALAKQPHQIGIHAKHRPWLAMRRCGISICFADKSPYPSRFLTSSGNRTMPVRVRPGTPNGRVIQRTGDRHRRRRVRRS
jgi:hypothetical protein